MRASRPTFGAAGYHRPPLFYLLGTCQAKPSMKEGLDWDSDPFPFPFGHIPVYLTRRHKAGNNNADSALRFTEMEREFAV